jgi:hypothetical protein
MTDDILRQAAAALGKKGGKSRSAAKIAASRANGRKNIKPAAAPVQESAPVSAVETPNLFAPVLLTGNGSK